MLSKQHPPPPPNPHHAACACACGPPAPEARTFCRNTNSKETVSIYSHKPPHMSGKGSRIRTLLDNPQAVGLVLHNGLNVLDIGAELADLGLVELRGGFRVLRGSDA